MNKILLIVFGLLLTSGGYLYYQSETLSNNVASKPLAVDETYQVEQPTTTPTPKEPTERALKASVGAFVLMNEELRQTYLDKFSEDNDTKEAMVNFALSLDSDTAKLTEVENIIATAQITQPNNFEYTNPFSNNDYSYSYDSGNNYESPSYNYTNSSSSGYLDSGSTIGKNNDDDEINIVGGSSSYTQIGNTVFGSDGSTYQRIGDTVFGNDGSTYQRIGNTTFSNDGESYQDIGNTTFGSDGTTYQQIGNTTFGSDGTTCQKIGSTTFCN